MGYLLMAEPTKCSACSWPWMWGRGVGGLLWYFNHIKLLYKSQKGLDCAVPFLLVHLVPLYPSGSAWEPDLWRSLYQPSPKRVPLRVDLRLVHTPLPQCQEAASQREGASQKWPISVPTQCAWLCPFSFSLMFISTSFPSLPAKSLQSCLTLCNPNGL